MGVNKSSPGALGALGDSLMHPPELPVFCSRFWRVVNGFLPPTSVASNRSEVCGESKKARKNKNRT